MVRKLLASVVMALLLTLRPTPGRASFHLVKIVEVFAGTTTDPAAQYVVLQMYFSGQNLVGGHALTVYDTAGALLGTFTFGHNVANGANLARLLIATPDAVTVFGVPADLTMDPVIPAAGGAVCWDVVDCVAWGSFSAPGALPHAPGTPFNPSGGLVPSMAMHRDLSAGGATTDFVFAAPAPINNAGQTTAATATPVAATPTATATPAVTPTGLACAGDCDGSGDVSIDELITLVNIALGAADPSACPQGIPSGEEVTVALIVQAVNNALNGCGPTPEQMGCLNSGGTVSTALCCSTAPDFPDTCSIGACGCPPASSHQVSTCVCGTGMCYDRTQRACVAPAAG